MRGMTMFEGVNKGGVLTSFLIAAVVLTCLPQVALSEDADGRIMEEVVVTGSIIRRKKDFETPSPIQTLDNELIQGAGIGQMQDLLRNLTVNAGSELNASQSDRQGTGIATTILLNHLMPRLVPVLIRDILLPLLITTIMTGHIVENMIGW